MMEVTGKETVVPTICACHCGGSCMLKVCVRDGKIIRAETDDGVGTQLRACWRGRSLKQRIYSPDRVLYPLKRTGPRGSGKFDRISWDDALKLIADQIKHVRDSYGPESILYIPMAGDVTLLNVSAISRVLAAAGGYSTWWGATSFHGGMFASYFTYGTIFASNTRDDLPNSRFILMWAWDPATTITGTNSAWYLAQAKENGAKIIGVDPFYNDSFATLADEWIPIRPGTDVAMLIAMAHVMIEEKIYDHDFIDKYTVGFDQFSQYVLGQEDGIPKTPAWAEAITGVPAQTIQRLAREYATTKPAALMAGIGPGRTAYGEQYHRATITLSAMTGNVGVHGGDPGARAWESMAGGYPYPIGIGKVLPFVPNPVEKPSKYPSIWLHESYPKLHFVSVADGILKGKEGGYPADYKFMYLDNCDYLNQLPDINKIVRAVNRLDFIVAQEQYMTASAKYADVVLPTASFVEREDMLVGVGNAFWGFQPKIIDPLGECRSQYEIAQSLAMHVGVEHSQEPADEILRKLAESAGIPDYEEFKASAVYWIEKPEPYLAFKRQIENPQKYPFRTPSGKIEIYSRQIADMGHPKIPPVPKYIETWESVHDSLAEKYPLQLVTKHAKGRANSKFHTLPWLRESFPHALTISAADARIRNIANGDSVRIYNDRGETIVPAYVTQRVMPGVVILPTGAWYHPDDKGVDHAGSANVLTKDEPSPAGSFAYNTTLVQVEKFQEKPRCN
jgi:anaerobic dimethyl sulfoxide reductase subunit A